MGDSLKKKEDSLIFFANKRKNCEICNQIKMIKFLFMLISMFSQIWY